nr:pentapeptide repeat-containing protein [Nostoc sp. 'Peltigera membranacea cyanobiont' 232]
MIEGVNSVQRGASLSGANLMGEDLSKEDLTNKNLVGAYLSGANLTGVNLIGLDLSGANLIGATLIKANLSGATLIGANLYKANLSGANLSGAKLSGFGLSGFDLSEVNLTGANLSGADLSGADLNRFDLTGVNLTGVNLTGVNLTGVNLTRVNLTRVNLSGANLSGTNLSKTQALGTDFTGAKFTGACLEDWNINSATKLNDIDCQYVYLKSGEQERRPSSGEFKPGEFTKLFQKALETVDLIFADGIDWKAFLLSFKELQAEYGEENLSVQAIEKKSGGAFVIRLEVPPEANKADIESQAKALYEIKLNALEAIYRNQLEAKDVEIEIYHKENANLWELVKLAANKPIQIQNTINVTAKADNSMVNNSNKESNFNFQNPQFGGGLINADTVNAQQIGNIISYTSEQKHNLAQAAAEIQQLLYQLSQTSSTTDEAITEAIHQEIKHNPTLKARLQSALKAGGLEALKAIFNHPLFNIPAETIKGFLEAE